MFYCECHPWQRPTWHCQSDYISGAALETASLKTANVNLIVALEEMSENQQVPQDLSFWGNMDIYNKSCGSPSCRWIWDMTQKNKNLISVEMYYFFSPKATSMHESINKIRQPSPVEHKEVNKLHHSVLWMMFLKARFLTVLFGEDVRSVSLRD